MFPVSIAKFLATAFRTPPAAASDSKPTSTRKKFTLRKRKP